MKFKEILYTALFIMIGTWIVQALIIKNQPEAAEVEQVKPGQSFVAPKKEQLVRPLMTEVDFLDSDLSCVVQGVQVDTARAGIQFSTCGAIISRFESKRLPTREEPLTIIESDPANERERGAFLVAFHEKTPYNYTLISDTKKDGVYTTVFKAETDFCFIQKEFRFYDDSCKIDLILTLEPRNHQEVQARLFVPSPFIRSDATDIVHGIVFNEQNVLEKRNFDAVDGRLWVMPTLFGSEDRYYINALVADPENFVQRAYYKPQGAKQLTAILEGPVVQQKTTWKLSFYCGPKQIKEIARVDSRLEATLDYGWLGPIAKFAMRFLNFIYGYIASYGWAIIILTLLIKLLLIPFTYRAEKSAKKAAELKRKLQYLDQKYKDDPDMLAREKADLIRKSGMSDMLGCLPMFAQIPILLGLNRALSTSVELYKASFLWMKDLSAIDPLYILPALLGVGMFIQTGMAPGDLRQRLVTILMSLVVAGVTANLAAGLVLFLCVSTWLSIAQSRIQKSLKIA